jgi:arylsulfatase A-like enzyme
MHSRKRLWLLTAILVIATVAAIQDYRRRHAAPSHILVIVYDTLRADHLGCYGYQRNVSPNIDLLASEGLLFENAVSLSAWTKPSIATLFTSLSPSDHGVGLFKSVLSDTYPVMARELQQAGYATYGFSYNALISSTFGFDRGFDVFHLIEQQQNLSNTRLIFEKALQYFDADKRQFFFIHVSGGHGPYIAPEWAIARVAAHVSPEIIQRQKSPLGPKMWYRFDSPEELEQLQALYDAKILAEDAHLGWLMNALLERGIFHTALIAFVSDHGEAFDEHGAMEHGTYLFQEEIHVPVLLHGPNIARQRRTEIVGLHDIAPTILRAVGRDVPPGFQGSDLLSPVAPDRTIRLREFSESPGEQDWFGVIAEAHKAIWNRSRIESLLFMDWRKDDFSLNMAAERPELFTELQKLDHTEQTIISEKTELDEKTVKSLRSLGYVE